MVGGLAYFAGCGSTIVSNGEKSHLRFEQHWSEKKNVAVNDVNLLKRLYRELLMPR